ncbi:MAG: DUF6776 family protein [Pseudomonadales bacterium]
MQPMIWFAGGVLAILLVWLLGFFFGQYYERDRAVVSDSGRLTREQLEVRIAELTQDRLVDQVALESARKSLSNKRQQIDQLEREVAFYKAVMAPEDGLNGLRLARFNVASASGKGVFELRWSLVQAGKNTRYLSGETELELLGSQGGEKKVLSLKDVVKEVPDLKFKFRYFQNFSVRVSLPDGFVAEKVRLTAASQGKKAQTVSQEFAWVVQEMLVDVE